MDESASRIVNSSWGYIGLAATPAGLARIVLPCADLEQVTLELRAPKTPAETGALIPVLDEAERQIIAFLEGRRRTFELTLALPASASPFTREVWRACAGIPFGEVRTYRALAESIGRAGAMRAVGGALGANPLPIVIPCHRVIRTDGTLGGFGGGLPLKRRLLALEGWSVWR